MNIKNLPLFTVSEICYDTILSYFLNNYVSGSKIPIICKGKYVIEYLVEDKHAFFYVNQGEETTEVDILDSNLKSENHISFCDKYFYVLYENGLYNIKYNYQDNFENIKHFSFVALCVIISFFINSFYNQIPCQTTFLNSKKKVSKGKKNKKVMTKHFEITDEFALRVTKDVINFDFDKISYEDIESLNHIKISIDYMDKFKEYIDTIEDKVEDYILLPFEEFAIDLDNNHTQIHCKLNNTTHYLDCIVYKAKQNIFYISINIKTGVYKSFIFPEFYTFENENMYAAGVFMADIINFIKLTLNYMAYYKVSRHVRSSNGVKYYDERSETKKARKSCNEVHIKSKKKYTYDLKPSLNKPILRKAPCFVKPEWERRSHLRHLKNGKVIKVKAAKCIRNKSKLSSGSENTQPTNYILS